MIGIYKITSPTGKIYIGQSWDILKRKSGYKNIKCSGQKKLYHSLSYHGWDKHIFEVIHELPSDVSQKTLDSYEVLYWNCYIDCKIEMLNLKEPGYGGRHLEESKKIMSIKAQGRKHSIATKEQMRINRTGSKFSDDTKRKISESKFKKVQQIDKHTKEIIDTFNSVREAASFMKCSEANISEVCCGRQLTAKRFIWKYIN